MPTIETVKPGVFFNMPAEKYFAIDAVSKSKLWRLRQSPAHVKFETEKTAAMEFGTAFETAMLEPERFAAEWAVAGQCSGVTGKAARCSRNGAVRSGGQWFCNQHAGDGAPDAIHALTENEADTIGNMVASVQAHPVAANILAGIKKIQPALVWVDDKTGLLSKGRLDFWSALDGQSTHVDLKVTRSAAPHDFERQCCDLGIYIQQSHYRDGCRAMDRAAGRREGYRRVVLIAVESTPDYGSTHRVECYELDETALEDGLKERDYLMARYARCLENNNWPGRSQLMRTLCLPEWRHNEIQSLETIETIR